MANKKIFCFGYGYVARFLGEKLKEQGFKLAGTTTSPEKKAFMRQQGIETYLFDSQFALTDPYSAFKDVTHILLSIPPGAEGNTVADVHGLDLCNIKTLEWVGYLSTTSVYGNQEGNWVDETSPPSPTSRRGSLRVRAEEQWKSLHLSHGLPLHIFRLSGIYGPGRSAIDAVRSGTSRRIEKKGHVFNRVHVEDIVQTLLASIRQPHPGSIYNVSDDMPTASAEVIGFACNLLGIEPPPLIPFEGTEMAPIVRSFYKDNKRVRNDKIKNELGVSLKYPDYRTGLQACLSVDDKTIELLSFENAETPAA